MKKGEIREGIVVRTDYPDKGEVILSAEKPERVVVKHVLEGQRIRFRIKKVRKSYAEGELLTVLAPSELEVEPDCPHFGQCGGCAFRTLPYPAQLDLKQRQDLRLLKEVCPDPHFEGVKADSHMDGYRNKMEFTFGDECKDGPLSLGLHKRGSFYDVITTDQCKIADEDFGRILKAALALASSLGLPYFHRVRHTGYLRHLLVRKAAFTGQILIDLVTTGSAEKVFPVSGDLSLSAGQMPVDSEEAFEQLFTKIMLELPLDGSITGILHTINNSLADTVEDQGTKVLFGNDHLVEELLGLSFKISPFSFFQTNSRGAEILYETAREYAGDTKDKVIFDLYSGTGTIAQLLAPIAEHVTGVEIVPEAVRSAEENACRNKLDNCSFIAGDVLKVIDELEEKPDLIILDPPRDGIHPKALPKIIAFGVKRIVYISCKPTSLARDLIVLQQNGYQVERSCCVDMFPGTPHVETVVLLTGNT